MKKKIFLKNKTLSDVSHYQRSLKLQQIANITSEKLANFYESKQEALAKHVKHIMCEFNKNYCFIKTTERGEKTQTKSRNWNNSTNSNCIHLAEVKSAYDKQL